MPPEDWDFNDCMIWLVAKVAILERQVDNLKLRLSQHEEINELIEPPAK